MYLNDKKNAMEASKQRKEMLQPMYVIQSSGLCRRKKKDNEIMLDTNIYKMVQPRNIIFTTQLLRVTDYRGSVVTIT